MPTVTFLGATGGCALASLIKTLEAGIQCTALARTPSKLTTLLADRGVPAATIAAHLRIVEGNAKDTSAVARALRTADASTTLADVVVSGLGGRPVLRWALMPVTLDDPGVCADAARTVLAALAELHAAGATGRPLFAVVSTTGVTRGARDVPLAFWALYHWLLAVPHEDKRAMEELVTAAAAQAEAPIRGFVCVRPSLLVDGNGVGVTKLRVGWEGDGAVGPAVGYTIARNDVGAWMFREIIANDDRDGWMGRYVTLTA